MSRRDAAARNGEVRDDEAVLRAWIADVRETVIGPVKAIYSRLAEDGRPPEEAMQAMAREAEVDPREALPILRWGPTLREAAETLEEVLADKEEPLTGLAEDVQALLGDLGEAIDVLGGLEDAVAKAQDVRTERDRHEHAVQTVMLNHPGFSREEAEAYLANPALSGSEEE